MKSIVLTVLLATFLLYVLIRWKIQLGYWDLFADIAVLHENHDVSTTQLRGTSQMTLRIKADPSEEEARREQSLLRAKLRRTSSRISTRRNSQVPIPVVVNEKPIDKDSFERIFLKKTLQPVKFTSQGVLLLFVDK